VLQFNAGVIGRELPIGLSVVFVAVSLPGSGLGHELLFISHASALSCLLAGPFPFRISPSSRLRSSALSSII
jgi:hypothetical protein